MHTQSSRIEPQPPERVTTPQRETALARAGICRYVNAVIIAVTALYIFLIPAGTAIHELADQNIRQPGIPQAAWAIHQTLAPAYEKWARARLASKRATQLTTQDISGTEWPLFGTAFYLWGLESLQAAWEKDHAVSSAAPAVYAKGAIDVAAALITDPAQANWVKIHWGDDYLHKENVFYRMLVIAVLTSHARLTGETQYLPLLKDQVDSLSAELDASPHGLLNDYPGECYPGDVLTAIDMIHRADAVLHTDHSAFVQRAIRAFQGDALDRGLVVYFADPGSGKPDSPTRGCDNSYVLLSAPDLWPEQAREWYDLYSRNFWQERWTCAGFREFAKGGSDSEWYWDVDSGPVWGGFGCAACAFGVGAARVNGHFEQAYPLTAEMLVTSWPLPNGTRLLPRVFSNAADAPYLGEAAVLFNLTRMPAPGVTITRGGSLPGFVLIFLTLQSGMGLLLFLGAWRLMRQWQTQRTTLIIPGPEVQLKMWFGLVLAGTICLCLGRVLPGALLLACAQFFPRVRKPKPAKVPDVPSGSKP